MKARIGRDAARVTATSLAAVLSCALLLAVDRDSRLAPAVSVLAALTCVAQARWLAESARARTHPERMVWRWFARAAAAVGGALLVQAGLDEAIRAGALGEAWSGVGFALGAVGFCSFVYVGFMYWNRYRVADSDRWDWVNGACAGVAGVAGADLLIGATGPSMTAWPRLQLLLLLAHTSALLVLAGTGGTIAVIGGLVRDRRIWLVTAALGLALAALVGLGLRGDLRLTETSVEVMWVLVVATMGVCSLMRPGPVARRTPTTRTPTVGALVVVASSTAILAVDGAVGESHLTTTLVASAAALGSGARLMQLVGSMAQLAQSRKEARTDELTGTANRRALSAAVRQVAEEGADAAFLIIDLDNFKEINDHHGHTVGDDVLRSMARRIQAELPADALLGRLGSDEFAVLLREATPADAMRLGHRLLEVCGAPVETVTGQMTLGASIGVAPSVAGEEPDGELLRRADTAMCDAKRNGTGVSLFDEAADLRARRERRLVEELRALLAPGPPELERRELVVHYQPQVEIRTGTVVGAEALVRWQHPELGLLYPDAFLHLVERHGLMVPLTVAVLRQATAEAARWHRAGHLVRISVNLSSSSLTHPLLPAIVAESIAGAGIRADSVVLEITETTLMSDPEGALRVMRELASGGVGISIDDYGTGYSSLAYLDNLPAVELKLDRAFTSRLVSDRRTAAIVAGTIDLAHGLGLRLVAEGVEDQPTLEALKRMGCDESQGFLHARPLRADDFLRWLEKRSTPTPAPGAGLRVEPVAAPWGIPGRAP